MARYRCRYCYGKGAVTCYVCGGTRFITTVDPMAPEEIFDEKVPVMEAKISGEDSKEPKKELSMESAMIGAFIGGAIGAFVGGNPLMKSILRGAIGVIEKTEQAKPRCDGKHQAPSCADPGCMWRRPATVDDVRNPRR